VVFLCLIATGLTLVRKTASTATLSPLPSGLALATVVLLVVQSVIYTYDAWYSVIYFGDEVENPGREIPRRDDD
jgi:amino acid transporter